MNKRTGLMTSKQHFYHVWFFLTFFLLCLPSFVHAEYIDLFQSDIEVEKDGTLTVTEEITYVFTEDRHGIFRNITTEHPQEATAWFRDRYLNLIVEDVLLDGEPVPYETEITKEDVRIKIGDPVDMISGSHLYTITYTVEGGLSYFTYGGAEIYWNVTGNEWEVPIRQAEAVVRGSADLFTGERACYQGLGGVGSSCNGVAEFEGGISFMARDLAPGEGLTVARGIDRTKVAEVVLERTNMIWFWLVGGFVWLSVLAYYVYRYRTAYQTGSTIIAQYEPYADFKPMYTGLLYDGTLHPQDLTAGIVYLAEQGYLKIKKIEKKVLFFFEVDDYEITLVKVPDAAVSQFQKDVLGLLFEESPAEGSVVTLGDLKQNLGKQKENQKILKQLKENLEKDLVTAGFFQSIASRQVLFIGCIFLAMFTFFLFEFITTLSLNIVSFGGIFLVSLAILGFMHRRRTGKGYEALDHLEGFRLFLSVTDEDRFTFHNAPEKSPEQFMEFLPYAIALGVEKEWSKIFADVTIPSPTWYDGGSPGTFSATNLSTSLGAFSTAFASSSGSSGSSGGGSVGGGGGGGGGGSW